MLDLLITNGNGRRLIDDFTISQTGWHISDHLPLDVSLCIDACISADMLAKRWNEVVPYIPSQQQLLKAYRYEFNVESAKNKMLLRANDLHDTCIENHHNPDKILQEIDARVIPIITVERIKVCRSNNPNYDEVINNCDTFFKEDVKCLNGKV